MSVHPERSTRVGVRCFPLPSCTPSCPKSLDPNDQIVSSFFRARELADPVATSFQLDSVPTRLGVGLSVVLPMPSCPSAFLPQQYSAPAAMAQVWPSPVLMA